MSIMDISYIYTSADTRISSPCLSIASFKQATTSLPACQEQEDFINFK